MLGKIVEDTLRIEMTNKDAWSIIENPFVSYKLILCRLWLSRITKEKIRVTVYHFLSAISHESLHVHIESDLTFSQ